MQARLPEDARKRAIIATGFTESNWKELGYLTGTRDWIIGHDRLLRSLKWHDSDYDGHVLDAIEHILRQDQNNLQVLLDFDNLGAWVKEHALDFYAAAVEVGTPQVQTAPDTAAVWHPAGKERPYDVALSFAGEDREHADALAARLRASDVRVFYDKYEEALLWGRALYTHLVDVYQHQAQYCVLFLSKHYAEKAWTKHELHAAQARAFQENREYILPVRLDSTEIPGLLPTVGYLACPPHTAETIATAVLSKAW